MKLLMITRKVDRNDALAGFTYNWVKKIAKNVDFLYIICLQKGDLSGLPNCVEIHSLGKEVGMSRFGRAIEFQKIALKLVPKVDGIFCHMNPEYAIAIWPYAKIYKKKIISWYTHKKVTWKSRLMERFSSIILTASKESFRQKSKKVIVTGHGIDVDNFTPGERESRESGIFKILSVGRISPTKDYESLIKAVYELKKRGENKITVEIIGEPGLIEQISYQESLKRMVVRAELEDYIWFSGPVPNSHVVNYYREADLFVNLSHTGSLDKSILEAMACGCLVITSNEAFNDVLGERFTTEKNNPVMLAEKIKWLMRLPPRAKNEISRKLRQTVVNNHNLDVLAAKIPHFFTYIKK